MSGDALWDVWLLGFASGADPIAGLVGLFGMTEAAAQHIEMTLPRAMKRNLARTEAERLLVELQRIGAKAELREHRAESARRSMSQPQMAAVGGTPAVIISSAPPREISAASIPAQVTNAPGHGPAETSNAPDASDAPDTASAAPLGTPVAGELSKAPRNIMVAIAAILGIVLIGVAVTRLSNDADGSVILPEEGSPDAEAAALMEGRTQDARAYMNNSRSTFSGADPDAIAVFIGRCYAAGARRVIVADLNNVGGVDFARKVLVELPDDEAARSGVRDAYARTFLDRSAWDAEAGDPEGFGRQWFVVGVRR